MRLNWRLKFTWCFTVLFSGLSIGGESLHLLPGMGHDHCCCEQDGCCDEHADDDAATDHSTDVAEPWLFATAVNGLGPHFISHGSHGYDADHCPLCHVLTQGVWAGRPVILPAWQFHVELERPVKAIRLVARCEHLLFQSRAPPVSGVVISSASSAYVHRSGLSCAVNAPALRWQSSARARRKSPLVGPTSFVLALPRRRR